MSLHSNRFVGVAVGAAVLVAAGSFGAVAANLVTSADIKDQTVAKVDIGKAAVGSGEAKDGSLKVKDLSSKAQAQLKASGYEVSTFRYANVGAGNIATVACPAGKVAVGGGYWFNTAGTNNFNFAHPAITNGSAVIASFPGRMDFDGVDNVSNTPDDNTVIPGDNTGWIVQVNSRPGQEDGDPAEEFSQAMTLYVTCITP